MACPYDGYLVTETDAMPLVESNKVLADTIGKTVVYCLYRNSGCTWLGSLSASPLHDLRCAFGNSLVMCTRCGTKTGHLQWHEHVQVCPEMQNQWYQQPYQQDHGVAATTLTQDQWYQQPYQQYYQNVDGYSMHQQRLHRPSLAPQHQELYVKPAIHHGAQTHSPIEAQPLNVLPPASASLPQAYPSVISHPQTPSLTFPASQGLIKVQAQSHFQQLPDVHPPQPLPTMHRQQSSLPGHLTSDKYWRQMVRKYGRAPVPESTASYSSQRPLPKPSLPQQHTAAPTTDIVVHNQMHQGGHFQNQHLSLKSHLCPIGLEQRLQKHPQTFQPVTPILGFQQKMNHHSASASHVGSGPGAPSLPAVKEAYTCLGKQVMEENVGNGRKDRGKSIPVERQDTEDYPSLNGTPLLKHALLEKDGRRHFNTVVQQYLKTIHLSSEDVERSGAYSSGSWDRGFDEISPIRPSEEHEPDFEFRPASQPSTDLGYMQFRGGPRSPISEHLGMPSHGPIILNGLRLLDIEFMSKNTSQEFSGAGGSFPGNVGSSLNSKRKATGTVEGLDHLNSQTREHQHEWMDMDIVIKQEPRELNIASENSSPFGNPIKIEKED
ncbi:Uncharacterized protein Rs2_11552 [Raphanus sativus]|nr:Uncharacterized protein Rs2_11552 [Raphanus sativus]